MASAPPSLAPEPRERLSRPKKRLEHWRERARRQAQREIDRARRIQARLAGRAMPVRKTRREEPERASAPRRAAVAAVRPRRDADPPRRRSERPHAHDPYCEEDHGFDAPQLIEECDRDGCYVFEEVCDATGCTHTEVGDVALFYVD